MIKKVILPVLLFTSILMPVSLQAKTYKFSPEKSTVSYRIAYLDILDISGKFNELKGSVKWNKKENKIDKLKGSLDISTLTSGDKKRDAWLLETSQIKPKKKNQIVFKSLGKTEVVEGVTMVKGILDMNGIANLITIPFTVITNKADEFGEAVIVLRGDIDLQIKNWNLAFDTQGVLGDTLSISFQLVAEK
jgi:polyisoprenoid-binding protein YceI